MSDFRRWLAGVLGQLANWLYPPYPERMRRQVDVTTVRPGTFSIPSGVPTPELLDALERVRQRRNMSYIRR